VRPTIAQILAQLGEPVDSDPYAACGCPLSRGPDSMHKFGCAWGRRGPILRTTAVREVPTGEQT